MVIALKISLKKSMKMNNDINGIIVVNKDKGMTSRDVINVLNKIFQTKKIGHTGTLDPIASGVLVVCLGKYTKLVDLITAYDKEYIAQFSFGYETDTLDSTGNITKQDNKVIAYDELVKTLNNFIGDYEQTVPIYSAVKIKGKKLYQYARKNIEVELPKRTVTINNIELLAFKNNQAKIKVSVSKGTYIRSLIRDIAHELNTYATMTSLIRTKQGNFSLEDSYTLEDIKNKRYQILKVTDIFDYPVIELDDELYFKVKNGQKVKLDCTQEKVILTFKKHVIAIYELNDNIYQMAIFLATNI